MRLTIFHLAACATIAVLPISSAPAEAAQRQYCRSLLPSPITWLWSCDPYTPGGTNDRSVTHAPVSISRPSPPSPPDNGGDDGCGDGGDGPGDHGPGKGNHGNGHGNGGGNGTGNEGGGHGPGHGKGGKGK